MAAQSPPEPAPSHPAVLASPQELEHPRFSGRARRLAHLAWWIAFAATILMTLGATPLSIDHLRQACSTPICNDLQLTPVQMNSLLRQDWSPATYAVYMTALNLLLPFTYLVVGLIIFVSKPNEGMAFFTSLMLVLFGGVTFTGLLMRLIEANPLWGAVVETLTLVGSSLLLAFFFLFPNGRFTPRWTRFLLPVAIVESIVVELLPDKSLIPGWLANAFFVGTIVAGLFSQIYRYRYVSNATERRQTRWVVFGLTLSLGYLLTVVALYSLAPALEQNIVYYVTEQTVLILVFMLIPITIGIAVLHSHLYDIDILINRTLVYVVVTASLAGLFAVSSDLSRRFFLALTGQQSDAATVLSTLIVVAAFDPVRKWVQEFVDERLKYRTRRLGAFGEKLRDFCEMNDVDDLARRFLEQIVAAYGASSGAVYLGESANVELVATSGKWDGRAALSVPLEYGGTRCGMVALGKPRRGAVYDDEDRQGLSQDSELVAHAIQLAHGGRAGLPPLPR